MVRLGWNLPAPADKVQLVALLEDALRHIRADDSFEGSIVWTMPTDEAWLYPEGTTFDDNGFPEDSARPSDFGVIARYRIGNSEGQGGMRAYTVEVPESVVGQIEKQRLKMLTHGPAVPMAMALVQFLADLDDDTRGRAVITLQDIIDKAKACLPPS
jgi:hypothetical protein